METLMTCGYFATGILTETSAVATAIIYKQNPREVYLTTGRINSFKPPVAHVLRSRLLDLGVNNQHIRVRAKALDTIQEVQTYDNMLLPHQRRNFLANSAQHPRLREILRRETVYPMGEVLSIQDVLESDHQYALLDALRSSKQQRWYISQEENTMALIRRHRFAYGLLRITGKIPLKGDLQSLSFLLYRG